MISNNMEAHAEALRAWREGEDNLKFRAGLRVARMQTYYGEGTIENVANDAGYSPKTLYTRRDVSIFMVRWMSAMPDHSIFSARRFFSEHPAYTYTHVRMAARLDFEDAIDALLAVERGDPEWDEREKKHDREVSIPMSTDAFGRYITWKQGGKPSEPLFRERGHPLSVMYRASRKLMELARNNGHREVELIIREAK